ncbi:extensin [Aestuariivirga litoralis]|uniref:Extensin n=1 Tax=Aestuariivirga litoralis TaxID=2650924 RepID=A0A2W2B7H4_9HYPH|nr:extensin family protein [Aestuariivirga litoralis]PZF76008.1 extensin [Aestuariivirga litoralis]
MSPTPFLRKILIAVAIAAVLAACSSSKKGGNFSTKGLRPPEASCRVKPSRIGLAEKIRNINEHNGCQVPNAWKVQSLGSVTFSQPVILNCGMAEPVYGWLEDVVQPTAQRSFGESIVSIDVAASYACRPRNNQSGAKMSEHGFGNALDISAFTLESGRRITVEQGWWGSADERRFLHTVHDRACGEFHTVLGPDSGRAHRDHLHLDLQNRENGSTYCR